MKGSLYSSQIAEPYAQALMSLAESRGMVEVIGESIRSLAELLESSPDLRDFIASPVVQDDNKKAVLKRVLGSEINPFLLNFLMLLVDKRRIIFLEAVCQQYLVLWRELTHTVLAEVISALKLTEGQQHSVTNKVKDLTGAASVELKEIVDPSIIGGVIIKVGSEVFDSSLKGQLRRISLSLGGAV
ncbi:MAG: ATP synthase F1 subunit delta [Snowella sp.]